jgi:hypothetical protein
LTPAQHKSLKNQLLLIQADENPLFVVPDFKWELFHSDKIQAAYKAVAGTLVAAGRPPNHPSLNIRIPLSVPATKRILFEVAKTIYTTNLRTDEIDKIPFEVVARLKQSAESATRVKIEDTG